MRNWISVIQLSELSGLTDRQARSILCAIANGRTKPWRGTVLEVREVHGRGGRSGTQYEVAVDSLPMHLKQRWMGLQTAVEPGLKTLPAPRKASGRATWWLNLLRPVLQTPAGSAARAQAYQDILSRPLTDWQGNPIKPGLRTLQRRVARLESEGVSSLARKPNSSRGRSRCHVTRTWDKAVPLDDESKAHIAELITDEIRGLVKAGTQTKIACVLAQQTLMTLTRNYGFNPNGIGELERICQIPAWKVQAESHYRKVRRFKHDRKAHDDAQPRIRRTTAGMQPMELIVGDVHHVNILLGRKDGKTATAKLIGWMDMATQRVWADLLFMEKRGGVRNIDQIESFMAMAQHPAWGLPQTVQVDNGSEYLFADYLDDALHLALPGILPNGERKSRVIRSLPYNAAAKPIEGWFARFENQFLQHLPGYIGDDRMNPKRPTMGKLPAPFPGEFPAFSARFQELLHTYNTMPQGGALNGKSPMEALREHMDNGWGATVIDPEDVHSVFVKRERRKVDHSAVRCDGRVWTCDELASYLGEQIIVCVPAYHKFNELRLEDLKGNFIGIATPDIEYHFGDRRGAQHSARMKSDRIKAIRQLDKTAPDIDVAERLADFGRSQMPVVPNRPQGVVSISTGRTARTIVPTEFEPEDEPFTSESKRWKVLMEIERHAEEMARKREEEDRRKQG